MQYPQNQNADSAHQQQNLHNQNLIQQNLAQFNNISEPQFQNNPQNLTNSQIYNQSVEQNRGLARTPPNQNLMQTETFCDKEAIIRLSS